MKSIEIATDRIYNKIISLDQSKHISIVLLESGDELYQAIESKLIELQELGVLNFTDNENGGKKDDQMAASR